VPGRYFLDCWVTRKREEGGAGVQGLRLISFTVGGQVPEAGVVSVVAEIEASLEPSP